MRQSSGRDFFFATKIVIVAVFGGGLALISLQFELQMGFDGGPFGGGDAVDAGVPEGAVGGDGVVAEDAV